MIVRSPYPPVNVPDIPLTDFVFQKARRLGDKTAILDGATGRTITYGELTLAISRVAAGLHELGFNPSDVMAICSPNSIDYAIVFHAVATLGGANTTLNPLFTEEELIRQMRDSDAKFLFTVPQLMDKARNAASACGIRHLIVAGGATGAVNLDSLRAASASLVDAKIN